MKAIWKDQLIAEAPKENLIYIEGNWYFPPDAVKQSFLKKSLTPIQNLPRLKLLKKTSLTI